MEELINEMWDAVRSSQQFCTAEEYEHAYQEAVRIEGNMRIKHATYEFLETLLTLSVEKRRNLVVFLLAQLMNNGCVQTISDFHELSENLINNGR